VRGGSRRHFRAGLVGTGLTLAGVPRAGGVGADPSGAAGSEPLGGGGAGPGDGVARHRIPVGMKRIGIKFFGPDDQ